MTNAFVKSVPVQIDGNVLVGKVGHGITGVTFQSKRSKKLLSKNTIPVGKVSHLKMW